MANFQADKSSVGAASGGMQSEATSTQAAGGGDYAAVDPFSAESIAAFHQAEADAAAEAYDTATAYDAAAAAAAAKGAVTAAKGAAAAEEAEAVVAAADMKKPEEVLMQVS